MQKSVRTADNSAGDHAVAVVNYERLPGRRRAHSLVKFKGERILARSFGVAGVFAPSVAYLRRKAELNILFIINGCKRYMRL